MLLQLEGGYDFAYFYGGIFNTDGHSPEEEIVRSESITSGYQIYVGSEFSVRFTSDGSVQRIGFNITIAAVSKRKLTE